MNSRDGKFPWVHDRECVECGETFRPKRSRRRKRRNQRYCQECRDAFVADSPKAEGG